MADAIFQVAVDRVPAGGLEENDVLAILGGELHRDVPELVVGVFPPHFLNADSVARAPDTGWSSDFDRVEFTVDLVFCAVAVLYDEDGLRVEPFLVARIGLLHAEDQGGNHRSDYDDDGEDSPDSGFATVTETHGVAPFAVMKVAIS